MDSLTPPEGNSSGPDVGWWHASADRFLAETARFPIRRLAALSVLVVGTAFLSGVAWEFWLEEPTAGLFGWPYHGDFEIDERWHFVWTSTMFAVLSLIVPVFVLWRTLKAFAAHQSDLERSVGERTAALRASQAMLATAEHIARVGSWDWDILGNNLIWSKEHYRLFGYAPEPSNATNENWLARVHPDDKNRVEEAAAAAMAGQKSYNTDYRIVLPDGMERIINSKGEVFRDPSGKPIRMVGTCHEVTERIKATAELKLAHDLLESEIESSPDAILVVDAAGRMASFNQRFLDMWAIPPEVAGSRDDAAALATVLGQIADPDTFLAEVKRLYEHPGETSHDEIALSDGRILERYSAGMYGAGQNYLGRIWFFRDITKRKRADWVLEESEARLRGILENIADMVVTIDEKGRIESFNRAAERFFGYKEFEVLGRNVSMLAAEPDRGNHDGYLKHYRETGKKKIIGLHGREVTATRKDGTESPVELTVGEMRLGGRRLFVGAMRDIAERKKAQGALRRSEERLAEAIRVSDIGIFDHDQQGDVVYWSPQQRKIYGWSPDEPVTLQKYFDSVLPEDRERVAAAIQRAHDPKQDIAFDIEHRILRRDGEVRWLTTRAHTSFEGEGEARRAVRTVGAVLDITDRKKAAAEIEFANNLLVTQIERSPDGILVVDADRKVVLFNRRFGELWKIPADIVAARVDDAILKAGTAQVKYPEKFYARVLHLYEHPDEVGEEDIEFKDGRVFERHSTSLRDSRGTYLGRVWIFHDITDRRRTEEALRQSQKLESVGQLTGGVAHNFNNLLSVVIGNLELLLDHAGKESKLTDFAQSALDGALRGAELTHHLLAFSRKQALQPKAIDLAEQLPRMGALLQGVLGEQIAVSVSPDPGLWPVVADPSQVDNAILNLALNARDAMPAGGQLVIQAKNVRLAADYAAANVEAKFGDYVLLSVSDTGTGIPPEVLERVFEPFFTTKEVGKGSGLGLSMVYGFVKQSNGHIKIESEVGRGTTVKIYLPRAKAAAEAPTVARTGAPAEGNEKILVVEDNEDVRSAVVEQLAGLGYRTVEAETGAAALALLDRHPDLDLVFSDVVMRGGMDGHELAREIRKHRPGLKILLTSGHNMKTASDGGGEGFEGFDVLRKPYRKHDLAAKLREILAVE